MRRESDTDFNMYLKRKDKADMKKLISLLLALVMVFSLATVAFASEEGDGTDEGSGVTPSTSGAISTSGTGTININGVSVTKDEQGKYHPIAEYSVYQMFYLETFDTTKPNYPYKVNSDWSAFISTGGAGSSYFRIDENGYVAWIPNADGDSEDRSIRAAEVAKLALQYAADNNITPVHTIRITDTIAAESVNIEKMTASLSFANLDLGYYLIDSSLGALCGLTTTNPTVNMAAKNAPPTLVKQVQEDSLKGTGADWDKTNDASIGETVAFDTTITVHAGAQNYVLHDKMDKSLDFVGITSIKRHRGSETPYTLQTPGDFSLDSNPADGDTFEITFTPTFCNTLKTGDRIVIQYTATVNEKAVIGGTGNKNETWLNFGDNHQTTHDTTTTYVYGIDLVKTDSERNLLAGAKFRIYDALTGGNEIPVVAVKDNSDNVLYYRLAKKGETGVEIEVTEGKVRIVGFDSDTYYLEETVAPPTYNKLAARKEFTIDEKNLDATINTETGKVEIGTGVQVVNNSGTILPQTGATGTAMFIAFGMFVMLTTGVLLVTKKRMSMIEE